MGSATTLTTPKEQVDSLIQQIADENGLEVQEAMAAVPTTSLRQRDEQHEKEDDLTRRFVPIALILRHKKTKFNLVI